MSEYRITVQSKNEIAGVVEHLAGMVSRGLAKGPVVISLGRNKRSNDQNRRLWSICNDISEQVTWADRKLSPEQWKQIISAEVEHQVLVPGIEVPFIALGVSTRNKSKEWFADFFGVAESFAAEQGVELKADSKEAD